MFASDPDKLAGLEEAEAKAHAVLTKLHKQVRSAVHFAFGCLFRMSAPPVGGGEGRRPRRVPWSSSCTSRLAADGTLQGVQAAVQP